jgi:hypothetical protein
MLLGFLDKPRDVITIVCPRGHNGDRISEKPGMLWLWGDGGSQWRSISLPTTAQALRTRPLPLK